MGIVRMTDKAEVLAFARRSPFNHMFEIADLDDLAWDEAEYWGLVDGGNVVQIVLVYHGVTPPIVIATPEPPEALMDRLIIGLVPRLPPRFYSHLAPALAQVLAARYEMSTNGLQDRMGLLEPGKERAQSTQGVVPLTADDLPPINKLYEAAYPDNNFRPSALESEMFFGVWRGNDLVSIGGVHIWSPAYKTAVLGTSPPAPTCVVRVWPAEPAHGCAKSYSARGQRSSDSTSRATTPPR